MYPYETLFIARTELPEAHLRETVDRARKLLEGLGASISDVDEWGVRELAYPIMKQRRGYYVLFQYEAKPEAVWEFERNLKIAEEILRFITVRRRLSKAAKKRAERKTRAGRAVPEKASAAGALAEG